MAQPPSTQIYNPEPKQAQASQAFLQPRTNSHQISPLAYATGLMLGTRKLF